MAKATETSNSINALTQTPGDAVLTALTRRLRSHARAIKNPEARRTMGRDMIAAADALEHLALGVPTREAAAAAMVAILGRSGYAAFLAGGANV
jgi:hypothetical protein